MRKTTEVQHLPAEFSEGDVHHLPFAADTFDVAISECTICLLNKAAALQEIARVVEPGGYVSFHDLCWQETTPESLRRRRGEIEDDYAETLDGWKRLAEQPGLVDVVAVAKPDLIPQWAKDFKRQLGIRGQLAAYWHMRKRWGFRGLRTIQESETIFRSAHTGYALIVGRKPKSTGQRSRAQTT